MNIEIEAVIFFLTHETIHQWIFLLKRFICRKQISRIVLIVQKIYDFISVQLHRPFDDVLHIRILMKRGSNVSTSPRVQYLSK